MSAGTGLEWLDDLERNLARAARAEGPQMHSHAARSTRAGRTQALRELRRHALSRWDRANLADA